MAQKSNTMWIVIVVAVILIAAGIYYFSGNSYGGNSGSNDGGGAGSSSVDSGAGASAAIPEYPKDSEGNIIIKIKNFAFSPSEVTLLAGQSVKWMNEDDAIHQVYGTVGATREIRSQEMKLGSYYVYNFDKAGTYEYHCTLHPDMKGTIIVK